MTIRTHRRARRRRLGHGAGADLRARRARRDAVGIRRRQCRASRDQAREPLPARREARRLASRSRARSPKPRAPTPSCWSCRRKPCARWSSRWRRPCAAGTPVIACAKGIEHGTHKFMTEIIAECAPKAVPAILSGPSFAADVARGLPTAVTLAAGDGSVARALAQAIASGDASAPIIRPTCAASRSAAPPRTCWRSPPASSPAAGSAPAPRRR